MIFGNWIKWTYGDLQEMQPAEINMLLDKIQKLQKEAEKKANGETITSNVNISKEEFKELKKKLVEQGKLDKKFIDSGEKDG